MNVLRSSVFALLLTGCAELPEFHGATDVFEIDSPSVGDAFEIEVHLPLGYEDEAGVLPVVYQLDGSVHSEPVAAIAEDLGLSVVVVGIGYDDGFSPERRRRDYSPTHDSNFAGSGGFAEFETFVRTELIPRVEGDYRLDSGNRTISGHSFGGLGVFNFLFGQDVDDPLFHSAIAASPALWWDRGVILDHEAEFAAANPRWPMVLFMSISEIEAIPLYGYYQEMRERIEMRGYADLELQTAEYHRKHHDTTWPPAYRDGLEFVHGR